METGQYFAVLESHSVIKQGLEHLKDTAVTVKVWKNAFCVSTQCADHLLGKQKHTRQSMTHNKPCDTQLVI